MNINPLLWTIKDLDTYEEDTNGCISFECDPIQGSQIWTKLACKQPLPPWCAGINLWEYAEVVRQFSKVMEDIFYTILLIVYCKVPTHQTPINQRAILLILQALQKNQLIKPNVV